MALALDRTLRPTPGHPNQPDSTTAAEPQLQISVVFTSIDATLAALKRAGVLASRLHSSITLLAPQVVPYPLPLTSPPVLLDWNERRFRVIAEETSVATRVQVYLCRDPLTALPAVLRPHSLVVVGARKRWWWPTPEKRLVKKLRAAGHEVLFTETE